MIAAVAFGLTYLTLTRVLSWSPRRSPRPREQFVHALARDAVARFRNPPIVDGGIAVRLTPTAYSSTTRRKIRIIPVFSSRYA
jgi:hypothetical protein